MALPPGFVDLATAYTAAVNTFVNIMGIVVDVMPPSMTKNNEHMFTFKLLDPAFRDSLPGNQLQGLTVRFFRSDPSKLPKIRDLGDAVLLRKVKMTKFSQQVLAISNFQTEWQVFPARSIPDPGYSIAFHGGDRLNSLGVPQDIERLSLVEQAYVIHLKSEMGHSVQAAAATATGLSKKRESSPLPKDGVPAAKKARQASAFGEKFMLVEELRHKKFANICVQVVKKFSTQFGNCELYVTDYTENKDVFYYAPPEDDPDSTRDGDEFGYNQPQSKAWRGPWGHLVLKVTLVDPHAQFANDSVSEGDFVLMQNVKIKVGTYSANPHLEGDMWPDSWNPNRVQISKLSKAQEHLLELQELKGRKKTYWKARLAKEAQLKGHATVEKAQKARMKEKRAEKRQIKQQKKEARQEKEASHANGRKDNDKANDTIQKTGATNPHIRCGNSEVPLISLRNIIDPDNFRHKARIDGQQTTLPFINAKYRTQVRVVGFEPPNLEDFAVPALPDPERELSPIDMEWTQATPGYEWFFSLLLEDAGPRTGKAGGKERERLWVYLTHQDAQYLLGCDMDDPQDLRRSPSLLAKLREKLYVLWGNLEEMQQSQQQQQQQQQGEDGLSNRAFECCVLEYGVEMDEEDEGRELVPWGWKRLFRLCGTTIL
ncbi:hypothetical protein B0A50_03716 [Salinomyces thailandicus]|uniref:Protection of telomeres protein 1 n=1 Tax=Salinomyces thailandicus TaxID=706561 RepID=A0A4U0U444_9PEZI|nr:hypothetical protein B0A50_03716 [Salinomyces thailandica]